MERSRREGAEEKYTLGLQCLERGQLVEAASAFREAARLDPNWAGAYCKLGVALGDLGMLPEAMEAFEHTIEIDPAQIQAHYNLSMAYMSLGNRAAAIGEYEILRSIDPDTAVDLAQRFAR